MMGRPQTSKSSTHAAVQMSKTHGNMQWARFTQEYKKASVGGINRSTLKPDGSVIIGDYATIATSGKNLDKSYSPESNIMRQT